MFALYAALFISPRRAGVLGRVRQPWGDQITRGGCGTVLLCAQFIGMLILSAYGGGWGLYTGAVGGVWG